jgi:quinol monooxygenase YgiN
MTAFAPNTFITLHPVLKILDWDKFDAEDFATSTKEEPGCIYYGLLKSQKDGLVYCREAYVDGAAAVAHLQAVGPVLGKLIEDKVLELVEFTIAGPADQLTEIKPAADPLGAIYMTTTDSSFTNIPVGKLTGEEVFPYSFCTIFPTFTVTDWPAVEKNVIDAMTPTCKANEPDCIYYGFTFNKEENKLVCREAYVDGKAVNTHIGNVMEGLGGALESGIIKLDSIAITGPKEELEITKETCDGLGADYHEAIGGFSRFHKE